MDLLPEWERQLIEREYAVRQAAEIIDLPPRQVIKRTSVDLRRWLHMRLSTPWGHRSGA